MFPRLARNRRGVAALEFALIAPILFVLIMGIIETGLVYYAQFVLKNAVSNTARILRTNQDTSLTSVDALRNYICTTEGADSILSDCTSDLKIYATTFAEEGTTGLELFSSSFSSAVSASTPVNGSYPTSTDSDVSGIATACNIVYLRIYYPWTISTPGLSWFMVNYGDDQHILSVTELFRNEPDGTSECTN